MSAQGKVEQQVEKVAHHWVSAGQTERIWIVGWMGDIVQMEFVIAREMVSMKVGRYWWWTGTLRGAAGGCAKQRTRGRVK